MKQIIEVCVITEYITTRKSFCRVSIAILAVNGSGGQSVFFYKATGVQAIMMTHEVGGEIPFEQTAQNIHILFLFFPIGQSFHDKPAFHLLPSITRRVRSCDNLFVLRSDTVSQEPLCYPL